MSTSTHTPKKAHTPATGTPLTKEARKALVAEAQTKKTADAGVNPSSVTSTPRRADPWHDLPANPALQKEPREKTTISQALKTIRNAPHGATLEEIKESFKEINMYHHDPKRLLGFMSRERGWGFIMPKPENGRIFLVVK